MNVKITVGIVLFSYKKGTSKMFDRDVTLSFCDISVHFPEF